MTQTVRDVLDQLAAGTMSLAEAEADFAGRSWPSPAPRATADEAWSGADSPLPDPNSWDAVNTDPRLTAASYERLANAYRKAARRR